ncbi:hypothetical protein [Rhizobium sp. RHZ01]|uniref:hypothetical protein n=1 Tax=Rhizobium sp. RHZ01 TaxID=2769304 RepID=UPI0017839ECF|nr:hypothetical protein [Rhizobium sp. RHZ01]MBD9449729.1 hypothetical protein [Rhizobium sp. RHZ01]
MMGIGRLFSRASSSPTAKLTASLCKAFREERIIGYTNDPKAISGLVVKRNGVDVSISWYSSGALYLFIVGDQAFPGTLDEANAVLAAAKERSVPFFREQLVKMTKRLK